MLKSTGCDWFTFNIKMGVHQVQLIVYLDVGLWESQFLKKDGAKDKICVLCFIKGQFAKGCWLRIPGKSGQKSFLTLSPKNKLPCLSRG